MLNHEDIIKLESLRIQDIRWNILRVVDASRPAPLPESLLQKAIIIDKKSVSLNILRREIDYLQKESLLTINGSDNCLIELTARGINVVYYILACPVGIARPELIQGV